MEEVSVDPSIATEAGEFIPDAGTGVETTIQYGGMSIKQCVDRINKSLEHPTVRFLREHMLKAGCPVWVRLLTALNCKDQGFAGGYIRGKGITVCCNHMTFQDEINQVLIHELIHAYDDCRAKNMDWGDCHHHACSEECVKRRALKSVQVNPHCSNVAAREAIDAVWDICYNDTYPFERAP